MKFKIRSSAIAKITAGEIGLSEQQKIRLKELELREHEKFKPLTDAQRVSLANLEDELKNKGSLSSGKQRSYDDYSQRKDAKYAPLTPPMVKELAKLREERDNPQLPQGAKTWVKQWIKQNKYKRWPEIKSKYIQKGNHTEGDGFTLMCLELGFGMVKNCEQRMSNDYMTGICDLDLEYIDTIVDNKSSWWLDTFPMFEDVIPDKQYEEQAQGYMELYNRSKAIVVYTLVDCPEDILVKQFPYNGTPNERQQIALQLIYTQECWDKMKERYFADADDVEFVEIPASERVKAFYFERDRQFIEKVKVRVKMCQDLVNILVN